MEKKTEKELLYEIENLRAQIKKLKTRKKYGLVWDTEKEPEKVVLDCRKKLPILVEDKGKEIEGKEGDPVNLLIEGDNYHSLSVLNYTHKGKVDVIYIDPPYNTGNNDFKYNDAFVEKDSPYRHSKWLNFIEKRLKLSKSLLSLSGVIFISIDDNEVAQLKILCDEIFGERNFITIFPRLIKKGGKSSDSVSLNHDYVLAYSKSEFTKLNKLEHTDSNFKYKDEYFKERGLYKLNQTLDYDSIQYSSSLDYEIVLDEESILPGGVSQKEMEKRQEKNPARDFCWRWSKKLFEFGLKKGFIVLKKYKNKPPRIYTKTYQNATISKNAGDYYVEITPRLKPTSSIAFVENTYSNDSAKKELKNIFGKVVFDYPKPSILIKDLLSLSTKEGSLILDFMAGSGTTGHAVKELNKDGLKRKFILCTNNEENICSDICHTRLHKLEIKTRYYKTDFVETENLDHATDQDKINLTYKTGEMIAIKENTFEEVEKDDWWQIFSSDKEITAIYFKEDKSKLQKLVEKLDNMDKKVNLYIFSWGKNEYANEFPEYKNIKVKDIPEPLIDVYKEVSNL
jgi:adenine-specific DNA-methyltransferase